MNARLCSLLVAGGVTLVSLQGPHLHANLKKELEPSSNVVSLRGISVENKGELIVISIPGFLGSPRIQTLQNPPRAVIDLPGVIKGSKINRNAFDAINPSLVVRSRIAQFSTEPEPVTRLVFEIKEGVSVEAISGVGEIQVTIGQIKKEKAGLSTDGVASQVVNPVGVRPIETEEIASAMLLPNVAPVGSRGIPQELISAKPNIDLTDPVLPQNLLKLPTLLSGASSLSGLSLSGLIPVSISAAPLLTYPSVPSQTSKAELPATQNKQSGRVLGDPASKYTGAKMSIDVQGADLITFLRILADAGKLNLIVDQDVQGSFSFKFNDTPWDQILDLVLKNAGLGKDIQNGVLRVAKVEKLQKEENERKALEEAKSLAGEIQSVTRSLSYAKASEAKPILEKVLSKRGSVILDDRTNTLIISDLAKGLVLADDLIATLDVQIQQVQIEAKVVEASDGYEKAFGVKWPTGNTGDAKLTLGADAAPWGFGQSWNSASNKSNGTTNPIGVAFTGGAPGITSIAGAAGEAWVSFISERFSVNFILQALEKEGKVKIVSSPKLVTQNNKKAKILSGEKIPYPSQQGGAAGGAITVAFADANLELNVTPQITSEGTIIMDIKIEKAEADFSRTVQGTPTILRKEIETQVLVRDGGTAVLGGVYSTNKSTGFAGVPFLSKLPFVGGLFRTRSNKDQNSELLIFITPRIIKN